MASRKISKRFLRVAAVVCALTISAAAKGQTPAPPAASGVALYAAVGPEFTHYEVSVDQATLTKKDSVTMPGVVQYAWPHPTLRHLYVVWSAGTSASSAHGLNEFDVEPGSGKLTQNGPTVPLKYRPIHVTLDRDSSHLLVVYNDPAAVTVYNIAPDGTIGSEVAQPANLNVGIYTHQVRVEPSNKTVIIVARGNYDHQYDPGSLNIFDYNNGVLTNRTSIAPGLNFNPRHLDFAKSGPWVFVSLEAQHKLLVYRMAKDGTLSSTPIFSKNTLAAPADIQVQDFEETGTVHVHPNGRTVYTANRGTGTVPFQGKQVFAGGENNMAVFDLNEKTGEPTLVQNIDTHGMIPRTFALDPSGKILVAANQSSRLVRNGDTVTNVPARLTLFRVRPDGKLDFVRTYDVDQSIQPNNLFWMGIMAVPR